MGKSGKKSRGSVEKPEKKTAPVKERETDAIGLEKGMVGTKLSSEENRKYEVFREQLIQLYSQYGQFSLLRKQREAEFDQKLLQIFEGIRQVEAELAKFVDNLKYKYDLPQTDNYRISDGYISPA